MKLIFEKHSNGIGKHLVPEGSLEGEVNTLIPPELRRQEPPDLPEVSELEVVRHYLALSQRQVGVDSTFYPLGSCTMKYNPKLCEEVARLPGFAGLHPTTPDEHAQGALELMWNLEQLLNEITGMDAFTLCPMAGAQGEWTGLLLVRAYHRARGGGDQRTEVLVPDSAHGTNPASAALAGFTVKTIPSDKNGEVGIDALKASIGPHTAALMLTNPNTVGLFETRIQEVADVLHNAGALLYYDGANLNALCGVARPGDMGFDIVHLNLHKTFSTPHGGGGPGSGPVGVKKCVEPFLPVPRVIKQDTSYVLSEAFPESMGRVGSFAGNFSIAVRAYAYIRMLGRDGIPRIARHAVLAARYLAEKLAPHYVLAYDSPCMHEFVAKPSAAILSSGVKTVHIAKRLIDYGFHPPTVYFPLIVHEAIMVEPTETEPKERLDAFAEAMVKIAGEALADPDTVKDAPLAAPVARVDEVKAARELVLAFDGQAKKTAAD